MGGKDGPKIKIGPLEKQQAAILKTLEAEVGAPIRGVVMPQALQTLGGPGVFQTELPARDRETIERQFSQGRSAIMGQAGARGGQLQSQLAGLERDRASDVAGAHIQARQRGTERALGLVGSAIPNAQAQLQAGGQLAGGEQERMLKQAQMQAQSQQSFGRGIGGLAALPFGKKS